MTDTVQFQRQIQHTQSGHTDMIAWTDLDVSQSLLGLQGQGLPAGDEVCVALALAAAHPPLQLVQRGRAKPTVSQERL